MTNIKSSREKLEAANSLNLISFLYVNCCLSCCRIISNLLFFTFLTSPHLKCILLIKTPLSTSGQKISLQHFGLVLFIWIGFRVWSSSYWAKKGVAASQRVLAFVMSFTMSTKQKERQGRRRATFSPRIEPFHSGWPPRLLHQKHAAHSFWGDSIRGRQQSLYEFILQYSETEGKWGWVVPHSLPWSWVSRGVL